MIAQTAWLISAAFSVSVAINNTTVGRIRSTIELRFGERLSVRCFQFADDDRARAAIIMSQQQNHSRAEMLDGELDAADLRRRE